ncbi:MAG: LptE family protein [Prolixibacteraceae bacterium]|nr:LptE family protein [Prolixibacteraceae bacterium]
MQKIKYFLYIVAITFIAAACKISYSFTGASISPDVKTYSVYDFTDRIRQNPTLSDYVAEQLKDKFTRQTGLDYANDGGDLEFEGSIVGYDVKPISVQSNDEASENRLTVRIKVTFTNNKDSEQDFDTEFSAYADFSSDNNISDVEDELVEEIVKQIVDDIFNKSVANW